MVLRLDGTNVSGFKFLFLLAVMYGLMSILVHSVMYTKFITPLGIDASLNRFFEARAIDHVRVLAHEIDGRQEGRQGLKEAAEYIKAQLERLKERAGSNFRMMQYVPSYTIINLKPNSTVSLSFMFDVLVCLYL
ncbi:hypothetical protein E1A91_A10G126200v1 [Gossypium mustelinum]|uniref:Uncharacterized protein n=1 Tax=Gossypium mustelinum TaxID=34275 RepID=A0A5D2XKM3_GOSMU|nr:hypothetical protein E1A91_A10G126200v1 [Gossypium mustelinum]